jgi:hypothetical protein
MPSPFPAPEPAPRRGRKALWAVLGVLLGVAAKYFLASHGLPAPLVDEAAQGLRDALPK